MSGSFPLGTIAGIRLRVSYTWIPAFALVVATLATSWFPDAQPGAGAPTYLGLGLIGAVLLFPLVLLHEAAHVVVARTWALGARLDPKWSALSSEPLVRRIWLRGLLCLRALGPLLTQPLGVGRMTLYPFGGVSDLDAELREPSAEFRLDAWGPLVSFILAAAAGWLQSVFYVDQNYFAAALFGYLDAANVLIGLLNLLPGLPLDGGRLLRSILAHATGDAERATNWSLLCGQLLAYLLMLWGIVQFFLGGPGSAGAAVWLAFTGWFLLIAVLQESRRAQLDGLLAGTTVEEVMRPAPGLVPASATLQQVADEHLLGRAVRAAPVIKAGRFAGLITLADLLRIPREDWPRKTAGSAMTPLDAVVVVSPGQPLAQALALLAAREVNQLPVVHEGKVVGMLGRDAALGALGPRQVIAHGADLPSRELPAQIPERTPRAGG